MSLARLGCWTALHDVPRTFCAPFYALSTVYLALLPIACRIARPSSPPHVRDGVLTTVFHVEQGFPSETELDELDPESTHFLLTATIPSPPPTSLKSLLPEGIASTLSQAGGQEQAASTTQKAVGTVRLTPRLGKVSRLAVDKDFRQYGYGRVIMEGLEKHVRESTGDALAAFKPVTREEDGKQVVRLKLHSQVSRPAAILRCPRQRQTMLMTEASRAVLQKVRFRPRRARV